METLKGWRAAAAIRWLKPAVCTAGRHQNSRDTGETAHSSVTECMFIIQKVLRSILRGGSRGGEVFGSTFLPFYELTGALGLLRSLSSAWPLL